MNYQKPSCEPLFLLPFALETEQNGISFDINQIVPLETEVADTIARSISTPSKLIFRGHEMHEASLDIPEDYVVVFRDNSGTSTVHDVCKIFSEPGDYPTQPSPKTIIDLYQMML